MRNAHIFCRLWTITNEFNLKNCLELFSPSRRNAKRSHFPPSRTKINTNGNWSVSKNKKHARMIGFCMNDNKGDIGKSLSLVTRICHSKSRLCCPRFLTQSRNFKLLRSPGIDSNESIPPAYVTWASICRPFTETRNRFPAWRAGTTTLFFVPARQA
jgi:hypothetical protein